VPTKIADGCFDCITPMPLSRWSSMNGEKTPHRCPVCEGRGQVSYNFYDFAPYATTNASTAPKTCRTCNGQGIVWKL
jgi:DnaJ-class molecular chaperone